MKRYICDICNKELSEGDLIEIKHNFGYGTELDGVSAEIDICEECFIEKFKSVLLSSVRDEEEERKVIELLNSKEYKDNSAEAFN